ncbi:MAG: MerR family transcriptional regulator [Candidatus Thiodiazotropha endolucinida]
MGISRYFTAQEVIACSGISYRRLDYWLRQGIIKASGRSKVRSGTPRLFTFRDIVEIRVALKLTDSGLRVSSLRKSLKSIRRQLPKLEAPLASERLVTDGKTVFRYIPEYEALECLDDYGQFAFSFGLGEEVRAAVTEVKRMPTPVRYKKRSA